MALAFRIISKCFLKMKRGKYDCHLFYLQKVKNALNQANIVNFIYA